MCKVSSDGRRAICYRTNRGDAEERRDKAGATFFLYRLDGDFRDRGSVVPPALRVVPGPDRADPDTLDRVYKAIMTCGNTRLTQANRDALISRGFVQDDPDRLGYRSYPDRESWRVAQGMIDQFGSKVALSVPGLYVDPKGRFKLAGKPGLMIPIRDDQGRIIAISCSPNDRSPKLGPGGQEQAPPKYFWLSSAAPYKSNGPSPGAPIHVSLGIERPATVVRITEGALKADLAQARSGLPTIGLAGVGSRRGTIQILKALGATTARIAFDNDWRTNEAVARSLCDLARGLEKAGFTIEFEIWEVDDGKGIDDCLAAGHPTIVVEGNEAEAFLIHIDRKAASAGSTSPIGKAPKRSKGGDEDDEDVDDDGDEGFRLTDLGNAERLIDQHGQDLRFCLDWSKWLVWDGRRWAIDKTGAPRWKACQTARSILIEAANATSKKRRKALVSHAFNTEKRDRISAMLSLAEVKPGIPVLPEQLLGDPWLFNCLNGTLDLRTGQLRPHRREDLITQICHLEYDPDAKCPLWDSTLEKFLGGNQGLIDYFRAIMGCAIVGLVRDHVLPVCYGRGANGKSTILGTLLEVFSEYGMKAVADLLMAKKHESHPTEQADLFGKRLVVAIESEGGRRLNESLIKELTGGDRIRARRMRENFWEFTPTHTLIMATNHKPGVRGTDNGIWRRIKLLPFSVRVEGKDADKTMVEKLRREHVGILAWCVRGCLEWQARGLVEPQDVVDATANYQNDQDKLGRFLEECAVTGNGFHVKAGDLYAKYCQWSELGNEFAMTLTTFGTEIEERGFEKKRSGGIKYLGLALRPKGYKPPNATVEGVIP